MFLYLVRHAQSQNNALPESQRVEDPGLTELGHRQARHVAEWIGELRLTRLFTSPFLRALQTAQPIAAATSLAPEVRIALHEQGGCYRGYVPEHLEGRPGMNRRDIEQAFPDFRVEPDLDGQGWWGSKPYESQAAARARARQLVQQTCREFAGTDERVAYVMHADFKLLCLEEFHRGPLDTPYNTSVSAIEITPASIRLADYNQVAHLPPDLLSR